MKCDNQDEADGETISQHRDFEIVHRRSLPEPSNPNITAKTTGTALACPERGGFLTKSDFGLRLLGGLLARVFREDMQDRFHHGPYRLGAGQ